MNKNIEVGTYLSPLGLVPQVSNDELLSPAVAVVNDVPHFLGWWWFI
jgi:hypothetical protein